MPAEAPGADPLVTVIPEPDVGSGASDAARVSARPGAGVGTGMVAVDRGTGAAGAGGPPDGVAAQETAAGGASGAALAGTGAGGLAPVDGGVAPRQSAGGTVQGVDAPAGGAVVAVGDEVVATLEHGGAAGYGAVVASAGAVAGGPGESDGCVPQRATSAAGAPDVPEPTGSVVRPEGAEGAVGAGRDATGEAEGTTANGSVPPPGPTDGADAGGPATAAAASEEAGSVAPLDVVDRSAAPLESAGDAAPAAVAVHPGGASVGTGDASVLDRVGARLRTRGVPGRGTRRPPRAGTAPEGAAAPPEGAAVEVPARPVDAADGPALRLRGADRDGALSELAARLEAALFTTAEPVALDRLARVCGTGSAPVRRALAELAAHLDAHGHATALVELAGGYQLLTRPEFAEVLAGGGASRVPPLSRAAMETLAIVAFWQPVTRAAVDELRGVHSEGAIATLLERGLIAEGGRAEAPGRPYLYVTTKRFLEHFGLGSLDELAAAEGVPPVPRPHEASAGPRPQRIERLDGATAAAAGSETEGVGSDGS